MLTLESIIRTTRHMSAHGETGVPVPRGRGARPRSGPPEGNAAEDEPKAEAEKDGDAA